MVTRDEVKVGDKLKRINGEHSGMEIGDVGTVKRIKRDGIHVVFYEYGGGHGMNHFIKVGGKLDKLKKKLMGGEQ